MLQIYPYKATVHNTVGWCVSHTSNYILPLLKIFQWLSNTFIIKCKLLNKTRQDYLWPGFLLTSVLQFPSISKHLQVPDSTNPPAFGLFHVVLHWMKALCPPQPFSRLTNFYFHSKDQCRHHTGKLPSVCSYIPERASDTYYNCLPQVLSPLPPSQGHGLKVVVPPRVIFKIPKGIPV